MAWRRCHRKCVWFCAFVAGFCFRGMTKTSTRLWPKTAKSIECVWPDTFSQRQPQTHNFMAADTPNLGDPTHQEPGDTALLPKLDPASFRWITVRMVGYLQSTEVVGLPDRKTLLLGILLHRLQGNLAACRS